MIKKMFETLNQAIKKVLETLNQPIKTKITIKKK
jgi:hypothetical protein